MTVGTTAMRPAAVIPAPASSLNVTVAAASQNTGRATVTMTVETTAMRLTPTVPTRVRNNTVLTEWKLLFMPFCLNFCQLYLSWAFITSCIVFHHVYMLLFTVVKRLSWSRCLSFLLCMPLPALWLPLIIYSNSSLLLCAGCDYVLWLDNN